MSKLGNRSLLIEIIKKQWAYEPQRQGSLSSLSTDTLPLKQCGIVERLWDFRPDGSEFESHLECCQLCYHVSPHFHISSNTKEL